MIPIVFKDDIELIHFADKFIEDRCLPTVKIEAAGYAPFPALLYCFSIVDLLGSLYAGDARSRNTTKKAAGYMEKYLEYPNDKVCLLQKMYRHKIVHLSQPKGAILYKKQIIAWSHDERDTSRYLTIERTRCYVDIPGGKICCNAQFIISIEKLKK
jgi:hypothetical protein